jgi:hypothetical protein
MRARKLADFWSTDRLVRSEPLKGIVIRFFVMVLFNIAPSLLVETLIVNLILEVENPVLY